MKTIWNRRLTLIVLGCLGMAGVVMAEEKSVDEAPPLQQVKVGGGILEVPASWKSVPTKVNTRLAQFSLPAAADGTGVDMVVSYFGGGATGGIQANLDRWESQFQAEKRDVQNVQGKCRGGTYVLSDIAGTWKKPDEPPFAQKTIDQPGSRVVSIIWILDKGDQKDHYFLKLSGPDAAVKLHRKDLERAIQADTESEKPWARQ